MSAHVCARVLEWLFDLTFVCMVVINALGFHCGPVACCIVIVHRSELNAKLSVNVIAYTTNASKVEYLRKHRANTMHTTRTRAHAHRIIDANWF